MNNNNIKLEVKNSGLTFAHGKSFIEEPKWIVIHYTGVAGVGAKAMCKSMSSNTGASTHYFVDEQEIYKCVDEKYIAYHCGTGKVNYNYKFTQKAEENHLTWNKELRPFHGNSCSIGVDLCVKKKDTKSKKVEDDDWYFENETIENCAKLVAWICNRYNITTENVIRHYDCTGKYGCPRPFVPDPKKLIIPEGYLKYESKDWLDFLDKVNYYRLFEFVVKI